MSIDQTTLMTVGVMFAATLVRATFGFGDALVAMPLLVLFLPVRTAAPLVAILSVATAVMIVSRDWREVDYRAVTTLVISAIVGLPFGVWLLYAGDERLIKGLLAVIVLGFSIFNLSRPQLTLLENNRFAPLAGFFAGLLGGAYNTHGPPLVIFGVLRGWTAEKFRATLQGYFLPTGCCLLVVHAVGQLWTSTVLTYAACSFPAVIVATFSGQLLSSKFDTARFGKAVNILLVVIGLGLAWEVFSR